LVVKAGKRTENENKGRKEKFWAGRKRPGRPGHYLYEFKEYLKPNIIFLIGA
jgi:hypothetical protein